MPTNIDVANTCNRRACTALDHMIGLLWNEQREMTPGSEEWEAHEKRILKLQRRRSRLHNARVDRDLDDARLTGALADLRKATKRLEDVAAEMPAATSVYDHASTVFAVANDAVDIFERLDTDT